MSPVALVLFALCSSAVAQDTADTDTRSTDTCEIAADEYDALQLELRDAQDRLAETELALDQAHADWAASHEHPNQLEIALPAGWLEDEAGVTQALDGRYCLQRCDGCGVCISWGVKLDRDKFGVNRRID
jgi:hypothetical protein